MSKYTNTTIVSLWTLLPLSNIQIIMTEYRAILLHIPMNGLDYFLYKKINVMSEEEANVICSNNLIVFFFLRLVRSCK